MGIRKNDKLALVLKEDKVELRKAEEKEERLALAISKNMKELRV